MITGTSIQTVFPEIGILIDQDAERFVGLKLFPILSVSLMSASYYLVANDQMLAWPPALNRSPGQPFARSITKLSNDVYNCEPYALEEQVTHEDFAKYARPGASADAAARRLFNSLLLGHELRVNVLATSNAVPSAAVAVSWADPDSDPLGDVAVARQQIFNASAQEANVMTVSRAVYEVLKAHNAIKALIKLSDKDARWPQLLAALFDVDSFVVARGAVNLANEGQAINVGLIWGDNVMLAHVDASEDFKAPSFGRTFSFRDKSKAEASALGIRPGGAKAAGAKGLTEAFGNVAAESAPFGITLSGYEEVKVSSGVIRAEQTTAEKITGAILGYRLHGVLG